MSSNKKSATLFIIGALVALLLNFLLEKSNVKNETSFETSLKQVLKTKEYEKVKGVIEKLISDKEITIQDVMKITGKSRTTEWRYMQKFVVVYI